MSDTAVPRRPLAETLDEIDISAEAFHVVRSTPLPKSFDRDAGDKAVRFQNSVC
ncbi:hypothetical protein THAOC_25926, partial [Thalassiosira oceanica]